MSILSLLSLFSLLTVSSVTYFAARKVKVPYTVLLVAVGLFLVPLSELPFFSFFREFTLTPELLFYIFLPILIFESAYNISIRKIQENVWSITLLSVASLLISAAFIATALYFLMGWIGIELPFIVFLIFGALISATDPVAVLALFKEYGAPRRLSLIFEGESLFNDGTAVALFLIVLGIAQSGFHGAASVGEGVALFVTMVVGGIIFGLLMGGIFAKLIQATRSNESVSIMLMMVLAHLTFIASELISESLVINGFEIKLSSIIATTIASMLIGNYGRYKIAPRAEEFVEKFWGQFAFIANSLVFILIGLLFYTLPFDIITFIVPILIAVCVVALGRALSIYPVIAFSNWLSREEHIPRSWQHLLAWGSLRGALAVTMVFLIPDDWIPAGWSYSYTPKEFILALTIGCIYATLFIKATTIGHFIRRLRIDALHRMEEIEYSEATELIHAKALERLEDFHARGYIDANSYQKLKAHYQDAFERSRTMFTPVEDDTVSRAVLRLYAIGVEQHFLRELFTHGEVSERVMRRLMTKFASQRARLEREDIEFDPMRTKDRQDWFEVLASKLKAFSPISRQTTVEEEYMYYRAKAIICRKVIRVLEEVQAAHHAHFFNDEIFNETISLYESFRHAALGRMEEIHTGHRAIIEPLTLTLGARGLHKAEESVLEDLMRKEMITPKLFITLRDQIEEESDRLRIYQ